MSTLYSGLKSVEQGESSWRLTINSNLESIYTSTEIEALLDGKADSTHIHATYFSLPGLVVGDDLSPVLGALTTDVVFSETFGVCLVDRYTSELHRIVVNSGTVSVEGTGEFQGINPDTLDVDSENMSAIYDTENITNGELYE